MSHTSVVQEPAGVLPGGVISILHNKRDRDYGFYV